MGKKGAIINFEEGIFGNAGTPLTKDNIIVFADDESQGAPVSHTHEIADVNGLQGELDGKVDDSQVLTDVPAGAVFTDTTYNNLNQLGTRSYLDLQNIPTTFAPSAHNHPISDITNLQTTLDGKVNLEGANTLTGNLTLNGGDLSFLGNSDFLVSGNRYAFRYSADQNYGMYFNSSSARIETKGAGGAVRWYSDVGNGNMWAGGIITASGGNSTNWNTAFGWGNHAGLYEPQLGNPSTDGYVLSSTAAGVRSWVPAATGGSADGNNYPTGVTFVGGSLAIQRSGLSDISVVIDGRYELAFSKKSAFNKDFGTTSSTVAYGNHLHTGVYEPVFTKNSAFNKNFAGSGSATTVARSDHNHAGVYATESHDHDDQYAPVESTVNVSASRSLTAADNGKTLICTNTITLTVPSGLGSNFSCNVLSDNTGGQVITIVGSGVTLKAPHGTKLLAGYTCNIGKRTGIETFDIQGELTT
jgi:hypothetical protein